MRFRTTRRRAASVSTTTPIETRGSQHFDHHQHRHRYGEGGDGVELGNHREEFKAFVQAMQLKVEGDVGNDTDPFREGIISKFKVGFYSDFIVSDKIYVQSKSAGKTPTAATTWKLRVRGEQVQSGPV